MVLLHSTAGSRPVVLTPNALFKLLCCICLDAAGMGSQLVPLLGEVRKHPHFLPHPAASRRDHCCPDMRPAQVTDLGYAPVQALMLKLLFQSNALAAIGFLEEILPFTDPLPICSLAWCLENVWQDTALARCLLVPSPVIPTAVPVGDPVGAGSQGHPQGRAAGAGVSLPVAVPVAEAVPMGQPVHYHSVPR